MSEGQLALRTFYARLVVMDFVDRFVKHVEPVGCWRGMANGAAA